jgi:white-opaque regulator 2
VPSRPDPFHRFDAVQFYAMSSFPPPPGLWAQHDDRSRDSPTPSASAPPLPVNLPPLSSIDPRQTRPTHSPLPAEAQHHTPQLGLPDHVPQYGNLLPSMSQYYGSQLNASGQYVGGPLAPIAAGSRFPIAPTSDPNSIISAGRHKKEIKKRTKTGCMTCRKRRIKVGNLIVSISLASTSLAPFQRSR